MPVDWFVCLLPLLIVAAAGVAVTGGRAGKIGAWVAGGLLALFLLLYVIPGWLFWVFAHAGSREAQFRLGNHYSSRFGNNWPNIAERDRWWLRAAENGHPEAMYRVGYYSLFGKSRYIPKDLAAARRWMEAARKAGVADAGYGFRLLAEEEKEQAKRKNGG
jgi:hypothetical protein